MHGRLGTMRICIREGHPDDATLCILLQSPGSSNLGSAQGNDTMAGAGNILFGDTDMGARSVAGSASAAAGQNLGTTGAKGGSGVSRGHGPTFRNGSHGFVPLGGGRWLPTRQTKTGTPLAGRSGTGTKGHRHAMVLGTSRLRWGEGVGAAVFFSVN